jgi:bacteriocin-like protein
MDQVEVLTEAELAEVVGGAELSKTRDAVLNKLGMCGCGGGMHTR